MHVDHFDWDDEDFDSGNTRHIESAGYDLDEIEDIIRGHWGPVGLTDDTKRPMVHGTTSDGEEIIVVFEIGEDDDFVVVRPVTAFPAED